MKNESYSCDRCGHTQDRDRKFSDEDRWMWKVTLFCHLGDDPKVEDRNLVRQVLWCSSCCDEVGLDNLSGHTEQPVDVADPPSFEDVLRAIIRDEIGAPRP